MRRSLAKVFCVVAEKCLDPGIRKHNIFFTDSWSTKRDVGPPSSSLLRNNLKSPTNCLMLGSQVVAAGELDKLNVTWQNCSMDLSEISTFFCCLHAPELHAMRQTHWTLTQGCTCQAALGMGYARMIRKTTVSSMVSWRWGIIWSRTNLLSSQLWPLNTPWAGVAQSRGAVSASVLSCLREPLPAWAFCFPCQKLSCVRLRLGPRHLDFVVLLCGFYMQEVNQNQTPKIEGFWLKPQTFQHSRIFISPLLYLNAQQTRLTRHLNNVFILNKRTWLFPARGFLLSGCLRCQIALLPLSLHTCASSFLFWSEPTGFFWDKTQICFLE